MPDDELAGPKINVPSWVWAAGLLTGTGVAGAGGVMFGGEPAASKAEVATLDERVDELDDKIDALDDKFDDQMHALDKTLTRIEIVTRGRDGG